MSCLFMKKRRWKYMKISSTHIDSGFHVFPTSLFHKQSITQECRQKFQKTKMASQSQTRMVKSKKLTFLIKALFFIKYFDIFQFIESIIYKQISNKWKFCFHLFEILTFYDLLVWSHDPNFF